MNTEYKNYLLSDEWAQLKIDIYNHRGRKCERCGSENNLHIHHLHYKNIFKEEPEDLIILCKNCHKKEHTKRQNKKKKIPIKYTIGLKQQIVNMNPKFPVKKKQST